jgi:hypothetical protein
MRFFHKYRDFTSPHTMPFVFLADFFLLLVGEVVLDVEQLPDSLGGLALEHACDGFAGHNEKTLDMSK